ncbi:MAG: response regulator, partial [Treponema sp.]|nr:response regulator [Treponema sp.]
PVKNKILIVDDEKSNLMYLNNLLGGEFTLYTARDGAEAIKRANEFTPDLILLDIIMPLMDGYEVLSVLKKVEKTRWIPVIFITGLASSEDEQKGLVLGADDYINKPFNDAIVQLRIRNQLKIVNQMHNLDRRYQQQNLMTSITRRFLTEVDTESAISDILDMIGMFMDIAQVLLFRISEEQKAMICRNEWINPLLSIKSYIGFRIPLSEVINSAINGFDSGRDGPCIRSSDPLYGTILKPYRQNFQNYIITPVYIGGKIGALLDFSKRYIEQEWSESEINLAVLVSNVFSNVFEKDSMQKLIMNTELAEKSSRAKSEFLSRMSHEIRTPLNIIIGMTNLAQHAEDPVKRYDYLGKSGAASRDLLALVNNVLDISDVYDGTFRLENSDFNFEIMLHELLKRNAHLFENKHQTFVSEIDPTIPETLIGDEKRLVQIYENLLSNANKFTQEHGSIRLKVFVVNVENDLLTIQSDIIDNGIGISGEQQDLIFMPFEQADGGIDRKFSGAGLGLYLARALLDKMEGKIWVESEPDKGSKFSFVFKSRMKAPEIEISLESFRGRTILLVDDIELNREIVMAIFESTQMEFVSAVNGREAVEIFSADPGKFDIILMDINMPEMDGVEATRRIRSLGIPEGTKIPIIAMTANTNPEDVRNYYAAGMTDHIGKPADFDEVLKKINFHLSHFQN